MDDLIERRRRVSIGGPEVWTFDRSDTLLTLALHAGLGGGTRLSWLRDIAEAIRSEPPDWDEVAARARAWGAGGIVAAVLRRAQRVVGADIPSEAMDAIGGGRGWAAVLAAAERLSPPERFPGRITTASLLTNAARDGGLRSMRALAGKLVPRRRGSVLETGGDERDRRAYLIAVAAAAGERGASSSTVVARSDAT
jgi:hypothetical protein